MNFGKQTRLQSTRSYKKLRSCLSADNQSMKQNHVIDYYRYISIRQYRIDYLDYKWKVHGNRDAFAMSKYNHENIKFY